MLDDLRGGDSILLKKSVSKSVVFRLWALEYFASKEVYSGNANAMYALPCGACLFRELLVAITMYCLPSTI